MDLNKKYSRLSKYFLAVCLCILTACTVSYKFNGSSINYDIYAADSSETGSSGR